MKPVIEVRKMCKSLGGKTLFTDFSLSVGEMEIVAVFGSNGCGKSTLLNMVAGMLSADNGEIRLDKSKMSYIFQNYRDSLFPWRTNYENLAFPLEVKGFSKEIIKERVTELQELFSTPIDWSTYPHNLSGGQQQMLAFMRALITKPKILLIDEAFSSLDYERNLSLREKLQRYYLKERPTILMVTHNIEEAVQLGHRVVVLPQPPVRTPIVVQNLAMYPRDINYLTSKGYQDLKNSVLKAFRSTIGV